jgi:hypothetical protein
MCPSTIGEGDISICDPKGMIAIMMINRIRNNTLPPATEFKHRTGEMAVHLNCVYER